MSTDLTTVRRGTPTYTAGKFGNAFSGAVITRVGRWDLLATITVEAWVKVTSTSGVFVAVSWGPSAYLAIKDGLFTVNAQTPNSGTAIGDGTWHHVAFTRTGSTNAVWVDGVSRTCTTIYTPDASATDIGGLRTSSTFDWPGQVDEVRVSNVVRYTEAFTPPSAPFTVDANTVDLYHLEVDGTSGDPASDETPPTAGTLAGSAITETGFTLTVSGASDETALHATPYDFSLDDGATWLGYQAAATYDASGLTADTAYTCKHRVLDAAGNVSTGTAITVTTTAASATPGAPTDPNILYSPGNWNMTEVGAITVNAGAYLRFSVEASSITLNFDTTNYYVPKSARIKYRVDDAGWTKVTVTDTVALTIPATNTWSVHTVEVVVAYAEESENRWSAPLESHVTFTGMTLSEEGTTRPVRPKPLSGMVFGDSITEGVRNLKINDYGEGEDATVAWSYLLGDFLGAEVGVVGFGGQKWTLGGNGGVPAFITSYASIYDGVARDFTGLDFIAVNMGANQTPAESTVTTWLTELLTVIPPACKVLVMRPFGGQAAAVLSSAVTTFDNPRVTYVDTTGWWSTADASDRLHPYGYASVESLAPRLATAVGTAVGGSATPTRYYRDAGGFAQPVYLGS